MYQFCHYLTQQCHQRISQWRNVKSWLHGVTLLCIAGILAMSTYASADAGNVYANSLIADRTDGSLYAGNGQSILKSADAGATWVVATNAGGTVLAAAKGNVYAKATNGVVKSNDSGFNWSAVDFGYSVNGQANTAAIDPKGTVYVGTNGAGIFKSDDGGVSWQAASQGIRILNSAGANGNTYSRINFISTDAAGNVYAFGENNGYFSGGYSSIYKSSDGGKNWANLGAYFIITSSVAVDAAGNIYTSGAHFFCSRECNGSIAKSDDGGKSWTVVYTGDVRQLATDASGNVYAALYGVEAYFVGFLISRDKGKQWDTFGNKLSNATLTALALNGNNVLLDKYTLPATATSPVPGAGALVNASGRSLTLTGDSVTIAGLIIDGGSKTVLITAAGPSLAGNGVSGVLANPRFRLFNQAGVVIASNDDWGSNGNADAIKNSGGAPLDPKEAALLLTLPAGAYTAVAEGADGGTGIGLVAVNGVVNPSDTGKIRSLSTRAVVGSDDKQLIAGFIITGQAKRILLRAPGPTLSKLGISGAIADPSVTLYDQSTGQPVPGASNTGYQTAPNAADINAAVLSVNQGVPLEAGDSAILVTLPPGAYTAVVHSASGKQGVGMVSIDLLD